ncbi:MAG: hypothetical protein JWO31_1582 [Phycisphaerales bacterium]|nr:hypothetical protein [Phycisphaerales bacterium]
MTTAAPAGLLLRAELSPSGRSVRIQADLRKRWKEVVRRQAPHARERFLDSADGRAALGAQTCQALLKRLRRQHDEVTTTAAGPAMTGGWTARGDCLEGLAFDDLGRIVPPGHHYDRTGRLARTLDPKTGRPVPVPNAPRLVLGRHGVRDGREQPAGSDATLEDAGPPVRRWTPSPAVELEDHLDGMTLGQALAHTAEHPSSCSAAMIILIGERKAKPVDGQW